MSYDRMIDRTADAIAEILRLEAQGRKRFETTMNCRDLSIQRQAKKWHCQIGKSHSEALIMALRLHGLDIFEFVYGGGNFYVRGKFLL